MQATNFRLGANQIKGEQAHRIHKSEKQVFQFFETVPLSTFRLKDYESLTRTNENIEILVPPNQ